MNPRIWVLLLAVTPRDLGARQERNEARRTALNVALREQVASYSAVEEDFFSGFDHGNGKFTGGQNGKHS